MATITTTKRIKNGTVLVDDVVYVYEQQSGLTITGDDLNLIQVNGEFVVDFGGKIVDGTGTTVAILPTNNRKIPSQLAYSQQFPSTQYTNAQAVRDAYATQIKERLQAGLDELRAKHATNDATTSVTF